MQQQHNDRTSFAHPYFKLDPALLEVCGGDLVHSASSPLCLTSISESSVQGKVEIGALPLCKVLFVDDSQYPGWLVLVPQQPDIRVRHSLFCGRLSFTTSALLLDAGQ